MKDKNQRKIKLLVVTPYFYPKIGGVEKHTYNLYLSLNKKYDYEIVVITSNHENPKEYKEEDLDGMKVYRLPRQFKVSNTPISFKWKRQIKEIIKKEKPSILMAHSPVPFISDISIMNKGILPSIFKYHSGSMKKEKFSLANVLIFIYERFFLPKILKKTDYIISTSDFVKNNFLKDYNYKSMTITPSVDINLFKPLKDNEGKLNKILFVGRIEKTSQWKGINYLIDSISIVKNKIPYIKLNLIGEGDAVKEYKKQVKKLGLENQITFLGPLTGKRLVEEYNKSNVLVLPSISEAESFGMVLIEAMACKKPVIGSRIGGIPYVIDDGVNGLLVPPKDTPALADAIIKILENPKLAKKMGEKGYKKVKKDFTLNDQIKKTNEIILEILRK